MDDKKKYKIVASDLDGTLLNTDQKISAENLAAIKEMCRLGVQLVPTTGRALCEMPEALLASDDVRYYITSNGTAVWDKEQEKMILTHYIPEDTVAFITETVKPYTTYWLVHEGGVNHYDRALHTPAYLDKCNVGQAFRNIVETMAKGIDGMDAFLKASKAIEMICIFFEDHRALEACKRTFIESGKLRAVQSDENNIEIFMSSAGKGNALAAFAKMLGVDTSEVIAVGDSDNDKTLLASAGLSLAMENAADDLKAIADKTICNNNEHSAKYILENFLK
ncbi:MAG: Cof-type HAD-IIB family hydrolase [Clostridia bacterium]|nr:Cof-type HAD-IIB family hydrolase [Clostridia bacterium]